MLQKAGLNVKVHNAGNWGDTTGKMLARLPRVISEATKLGPLVCICVLGGTNDILRNLGTVPDILGRLQKLHQITANAPYMPQVGVMSLPPVRNAGGWESARLSLNEGLRQSLKHSACSRRFFVDLETVASALSSDGVHFTADGYSEFATRVFESLHPALARQLNSMVLRESQACNAGVLVI